MSEQFGDNFTTWSRWLAEPLGPARPTLRLKLNCEMVNIFTPSSQTVQNSSERLMILNIRRTEIFKPEKDLPSFSLADESL